MKKHIETLLLQSNTNEAKNIIFKEINSNPNIDPEFYSLLGSAYAIEKNNQLAMQYFNVAYELAPKNFNIVTTISNFLIANGDQQSAMILMERLATVEATNTSNEQIEMLYDGIENTNNDSNNDFDYMDFILGGGDALNYEYSSNENITSNEKIKTTQKPTQSSGFSYSELITNDDINDVLAKYNLPKLDLLKSKIKEQNTVNKSEEKETLKQVQGDKFYYSSHSELVSESLKNIATTHTVKQMQKPKMLFTMYGWNESGGGTVLPKAVITEFAKRGYEVAVFYATAKHPTEKTPYFMEKIIDNGVRLYGVYNRPTIFLDADNPLREICDSQIISLFNSVLDEFQPNIINFHNFLGLSFEMATVAKSRNIVSTFTTHNYHLLDPKLYIYNNDLVSWKSTDFFENSDLPIRYPMLKDAYKSRIEKAKSLLLNEIDYIFAVSNRVKELLTNFCGNGERICVINQIHSSLKPLMENNIHHTVGEKIRFVFIGDPIPHKGVHLIPQAAQFLTNSNISFDIWGDFDNEYGKAIKSIDKTNMISLRGKYSANDLRKIAEQSDIALFTSICEDCAPIVLSEYLAMNLPVVAAKIGGVEDFIVDGYNGSLFKAGSPKALAAVIQSLVENPFKIEKMRNHCNIPYSFDDYISHLENIFIRLASGERPKANEFSKRFVAATYPVKQQI